MTDGPDHGLTSDELRILDALGDEQHRGYQPRDGAAEPPTPPAGPAGASAPPAPSPPPPDPAAGQG